MTTNPYKGKRVCVIGGAGMIGHHLVKLLADAGAEVFVLDDFSRGHNVLNEPSVRYTEGDATNLNTCEWMFRGMVMRGTPIDAVFNLAAKVAGVMYNMNNHLDMFYNNVNALTIPVMAAEKVGVGNYLQTSSVCVYDPDHNHPCVEENGLLGEPHPSNRGYALAKRMGEYAVIMSNIPHAVVVRPSNVYGVGDYFDERAHVIPALMKKVEQDDTIHVKGTPGTVREFIYAEDAARGMMSAMQHGTNKAAYNIGTNGNVIDIGSLVNLLQDVAGTDKPVEFGEQHGEDKRWSDCSLAYDELDWKPEVEFGDGLRRMYAWAKENGKI